MILIITIIKIFKKLRIYKRPVEVGGMEMGVGVVVVIVVLEVIEVVVVVVVVENLYQLLLGNIVQMLLHVFVMPVSYLGLFSMIFSGLQVLLHTCPSCDKHLLYSLIPVNHLVLFLTIY